MSDFTTITFTTTALSHSFRRGDAVRLTPDIDGMGTKVVVRVHPTWIDVRAFRWYDRVRWFIQRTARRLRVAVVRILALDAPPPHV